MYISDSKWTCSDSFYLYYKKVLNYYYKRLYFCGINFSRWAAQKHLRVKFAFSRCSLAMFLYYTKLASFSDAFTSNWKAQKQIKPHTYTLEYTHTHQQINRYCKYFRGFFKSHLPNLARNSQKFIHRKYYYFNTICTVYRFLKYD